MMLSFENITFVPSIHQRMIFADEMRRVAQETEPDCIAVELPRSLESWLVRGVLQLPHISAVCYPSADSPGEMNYIPIDPCDSMIDAVRLAIDHELPLYFIDDEDAAMSGKRTLPRYDLPDELMIEQVGLEAYVETVLPYLARASESDAEREESMTRKLVQLACGHKRILCVLGLAHYRGITERIRGQWNISVDYEMHENEKPTVGSIEGSFLAHVVPKSIPELLREIPYLAWLREEHLEDLEMTTHPGESTRFEKMEALISALKQAEEKYEKEYDSEIGLGRFKTLVQYVRNLSFVHGRLQPALYESVIASKSVVDGDYGYEVFNLLRAYPPQEEDSPLPKLNLRNGRGSFSDREEKFRMTPVFEEAEMQKIKIHFRRRPSLEMKQIWKKEWGEADMRGICSWPPEDELQERFMAFIRKRALQVLSEDKKQVIEFTTSILDGLDIRETMRNWHTGKIFVQHTPQPQGQVGAVVLIFDPSMDERYPWRCTLYAENQNESDISFYATPMGENVVGPRICRTEFGGILSIYPANHIPDIWNFPDIDEAESCADALMVGAILFSDHKYIAYIASKPPTSLMRSIAARYRKHIIYLPIRNFSQEQLKKVRHFHILNGHDVRGFAGDYIF